MPTSKTTHFLSFATSFFFYARQLISLVKEGNHETLSWINCIIKTKNTRLIAVITFEEFPKFQLINLRFYCEATEEDRGLSFDSDQISLHFMNYVVLWIRSDYKELLFIFRFKSLFAFELGSRAARVLCSENMAEFQFVSPFVT